MYVSGGDVYGLKYEGVYELLTLIGWCFGGHFVGYGFGLVVLCWNYDKYGEYLNSVVYSLFRERGVNKATSSRVYRKIGYYLFYNDVVSFREAPIETRRH